MSPLLISYLTYSLVAVGLTVWLAATLFRHGAMFLRDVFDDREVAEAVNRLLVTGFYMLNLGWAFLIIRTSPPEDAIGAFENLAARLGLLLVSLAVIHFVNLLVFNTIRRRRRLEDLPPVTPTFTAPPPGGPNPYGPFPAPTT